MHPSYSPLFTWGLLAERCMGSSSRSPVVESPSRSAPPPSSQPTPNDDGSVFYFTLQPSKRDTVEFNSSFLYLDLADHRSTTTTHRRKPSTLSKSTSWICTANVNSTYDLSRKEKEKLMKLMSPSTPPVHTHRRSSKESLRNLPSPKPAPSSTLPELPIPSQSPSSVLSSPAASTFSSHKASHSAPTLPSALLSPSGRTSNPCSLRSASISSRDRRKSRMDALACLEGRSRAPNRITRSSLRNNFMDLSDDEDENATRTSKSNPPSASEPTPPQIVIEDQSSFADVEDEADAISPTLSRKRVSSSQSKSPRPGRKRRSTIEGWFPLKSFIDFNKDEDTSSWNWRSFIEIGGVA